MSKLHMCKNNIRRSFGKIKDIAPVPNLIEIQSSSFNEFAQLDFLPQERKLVGLEKVLRDIFPIDSNDNYFVKLTGPSETVSARRDEFIKLVQSARFE